MKRKRLTLMIAGAIAFALAFIMSLRSVPAQDRFDLKVRNDFVAGFKGDNTNRAMCEDALRTNPSNAETLVWHGVYQKRAEIWLTTKTLTPQQPQCAGCHTGSK